MMRQGSISSFAFFLLFQYVCLTMDHIAILQKEWLPKILAGEKTIESRWYKQKRTPYQNIHPGETIYFKETGKPVTAKATVQKALFFDALTEEKLREILQIYGKQINMTLDVIPGLLDKKYSILVMLKEVESIQPFTINKKGFGNMAAWITVKNIENIRKNNK